MDTIAARISVLLLGAAAGYMAKRCAYIMQSHRLRDLYLATHPDHTPQADGEDMSNNLQGELFGMYTELGAEETRVSRLAASHAAIQIDDESMRLRWCINALAEDLRANPSNDVQRRFEAWLDEHGDEHPRQRDAALGLV